VTTPDGQTDGQTDRRTEFSALDRVCILQRGKNDLTPYTQ